MAKWHIKFIKKGDKKMSYIDAGVLTAIVIALAELVKKMGVPAKYVPLFALCIGIVAGIVYLNPGDVQKGILNGVIIGLAASGLYSGTKNIVQKRDEEEAE